MNDTIAAISTAQGIGAISIIRVSGDEAIKIVSSIFSNKEFPRALSHTIHYGYIMDNNEKVDEVLVSLMRAPKTFTMEDVVEINAHGGITTTNKILELLLTNGCRLAEPGEFTKRAFLNGRIDLTEAEGIIDLINAKTEKSREMAINQVSGKASLMIRNLRERLAGILANIEVNLNYPEYEDIEEMTTSKIKESMDEIESKINQIILESKNGELLKNGIKTAIIGRPNVGKSSLVNALLNEERVIVSDTAGTTRDAIDTPFTYHGQKFTVIDTAGMRKRGKIYERAEKYSLLRSMKAIDRSDVCLLVINAEEGIIEHDKHIAGYAIEAGKAVIIVVNKWDLIDDKDANMKKFIKDIRANFQFIPYAPIVFLSALTKKRIHTLMPEVIKAYKNSRQEIKTNLLNDVINEAYALNLPPSYKGKRLKIYYSRQVSIAPPTFNIYVNSKGLVHFSYERYIENKIRESFDFEGTPIVIQFKNKGEQEI